MKKLKLTRALQEAINRQAADAYPDEGCGLLLGEAVAGENLVKALFPVENRWEVEADKRRRFQISPDDMLRAEAAALAQGWDVIGVYHSHPDSPPVASPRDLAWATWPGYSYLITEARQGQAGLSRSWQLREDRRGFIEEEIVYL